MPITINGSTGLTGVAAIDNVSSTELGYLDGVTSAVQTQINAKAADSTQGLYLITSQVFTTAGTVSVDNCFSSTYANYRIVVSFSAASANNDLSIRLRKAGADSQGAATYQTNHLYLTATSVTGQSNPVNQTSWYISTIESAQPARTFFTMDIVNPAAATQKSMRSDGHSTINGGNSYWRSVSGYMTDTTAHDGFTLYPSTGTVSGRVSVYGYKN